MLIAMAVYDTVENGRTPFTRATLRSLAETVAWDRHRLVISDNGSCKETVQIYDDFENVMPFSVIYNGSNIGTANAINRAWFRRRPGEPCVKMDNDVVIHAKNWADQLEEVFFRDPSIGICGLKRKDLQENPWTDDPQFRSQIRMLPHMPGERWLVVEVVHHVMGTCQAYSGALLDMMGYLVQPSQYGFDDSLAAVRAKVLGYNSAFLLGIEIDHIDPGGTAFTQWKLDEAGRMMHMFNKLRDQYISGRRSPYYDGGFD